MAALMVSCPLCWAEGRRTGPWAGIPLHVAGKPVTINDDQRLSAIVRRSETMETDAAKPPATAERMRPVDVRDLLSAGEAEKASRLADDLFQQTPGSVWVWSAYVDAKLANGDIAAAQAMLADHFSALEEQQPKLCVRQLRAVCKAIPSQTERLEFLARCAALAEGNQDVQVFAGTSFLSGRQNINAAQYLERAHQLGPLPSYAKSFHEMLLPLSLGYVGAAEALKAAYDDEMPPQALRRLMRFLCAAGRVQEASEILDRTLASHIDDWQFVYRTHRMGFVREDDLRRFAMLRDHAGKTSDLKPVWYLQYGLFALKCGERDVARDAFARAMADPASAQLASLVLDTLEALSDLPEPRPELDSDDLIQVVSRPDAKGTIVVFAGLAGTFSVTPNRELDRLLSQHPVNVVYLRDPRGTLYFDGLDGIDGGESGLHRHLGDVVGTLAAPKTVCIGASGGGYAALRGGLALGADEVWSFAGSVTLEEAEDGEFPHLSAAEAELSQNAADHQTLDDLTNQSSTRLRMIIGDGYAPDQKRAAAVADHPMVSVEELPGVAHHHSGTASVASGHLAQLMTDAFG